MGRRRVRWGNLGRLVALLAAALLIATRDDPAPPAAQAPDLRSIPRLLSLPDGKEVTHHRRTQAPPDHLVAAPPPPPTSGEFTPDPTPP